MLGSPNLFIPSDDTMAGKAVKSYAGMAHFAGTGPQFESCQRCRFWIKPPLKPNSKNRVCEEFHRITRNWGDPIPSGASACKYFQLRKNAGVAA